MERQGRRPRPSAADHWRSAPCAKLRGADVVGRMPAPFHLLHNVRCSSYTIDVLMSALYQASLASRSAEILRTDGMLQIGIQGSASTNAQGPCPPHDELPLIEIARSKATSGSSPLSGVQEREAGVESGRAAHAQSQTLRANLIPRISAIAGAVALGQPAGVRARPHLPDQQPPARHPAAM